MGAVVALGVFGLCYVGQKRTIFNKLYTMKLPGAPKQGTKIENFQQFYADSAPQILGWYLNCFTSSIIAGAVRPMVDGQPKVVVAQKKA